MDAQLQGIIDKIQQDGVKNAEEQAAAIVAEAERTAKAHIDAARKEADKMVADAEAERERFLASGRAALEQSGRDLILSIKAQIQAIFTALISEEVGKSMSPDNMAQIVAEIAKAWASTEGVEVLVAESAQAQLDAAMRKVLSDKLAAGITIRPVATSSAGFRIGSENGSVHYDFTDDSIADLLSQYLNPRLAAIVEKAAKG